MSRKQTDNRLLDYSSFDLNIVKIRGQLIDQQKEDAFILIAVQLWCQMGKKEYNVAIIISSGQRQHNTNSSPTTH